MPPTLNFETSPAFVKLKDNMAGPNRWIYYSRPHKMWQIMDGSQPSGKWASPIVVKQATAAGYLQGGPRWGLGTLVWNDNPVRIDG